MSLTTRRPIRYLITTGEATPSNFPDKAEDLLATIRRAVAHGIELIQIREKNLTPKLLFELAIKAASLTRHSNTKLLINDRFDIALAAGADGVHLTASSLSAAFVRRCVPSDFLIGVSTHSSDEIEAAKAGNADFAVYGPVFSTPGKGDPTGLADLREICTAANGFPILALGGVDGSNVGDVISSGASGVAAIRYLNDFVNIKQ